MRITTLFLAFCFFLTLENSNAGNVTISGTNPGYAGESITLNLYENLITSDEKIITTFTPDNLWYVDDCPLCSRTAQGAPDGAPSLTKKHYYANLASSTH